MPRVVAADRPEGGGSGTGNLIRRLAKPKILIAAGVIAALFVLGRMVEIDSHLRSLQMWIRDFGVWGPVVYVVFFVVATLVFIPATPLMILAPFLFGTLWGYFAVTAATSAAAVAGFFTARTFGREMAERKLGETDVFRKIRRMVEKNRRVAIPFVRLVPMLPFALNDYALGLTRISFWSYLFWSEMVFIPMNAVIVLGAGAIYAAVVRGEASWWLIGLSAGGALLVLGSGFLIKRVLGPGAGEKIRKP